MTQTKQGETLVWLFFFLNVFKPFSSHDCNGRLLNSLNTEGLLFHDLTKIAVPCVSVASYHTGSLAFGSLIIAIVQFIRAVLAYLQAKFEGTLFKVSQVWQFSANDTAMFIVLLVYCSYA